MTRGVFDNKTGKRFGRLTAIEYRGGGRWYCRCDCGGETISTSKNLGKGLAKSCGCLQREAARAANTKHGQYNDPLYKVWCAMKQRCYNSNNRSFKNYGGRGISVCSPWRESFESFREWAFSNGYKRGLSIDRIDVNGGYQPENCRWVGMSAQNANKRPYRIPNAYKAIEEVGEDGEILASYPSIRDAAESIGVKPKSSHIGEVCKGYRKTAHGRRWRYASS